MALNIQTVDVPITGGLDVKTNANALNPPMLTTADNVIYQTNGALRKRNGFSALVPSIVGGGGLSLSLGISIQNVNGELVYCDNQSVYTYSPLVNAWINRGNDSFSGVTLTPMSLGSNPNTTPAPFGNIMFADTNGYRAVAFNGTPEYSLKDYNSLNTNLLYLGLWDVANNRWLITPQQPPVPQNYYTQGRPVVAAFGNYFYFFNMACSINGSGTQRLIVGYMVYAGATTTASNLFNSSITNLPAIATTTYGGVGDITDTYLDVAVNGSTLFLASGPVATSTESSRTGQISVCLSAGTTTMTTVISSTGCFGHHNISAGSSFGFITGSPFSSVSGIGAGTCVSGAVFNIANPWSIGTATIVAAPTAGLGEPVVHGWGTFSSFNGTALAILGPQIVASTVTLNIGQVLGITGLNTWALQRFTALPNGGAYTWSYALSKPVYNTIAQDWYVWGLSTGAKSQVLQPTAFLGQVLGPKRGRASYDVAQVYTATKTPIGTAGVPQTNLSVPVISGNILQSLAVLTTTNKSIIPLSTGALIAGARPMYYDGQVVRLAGFDSYPEMPAAVASYTTTGVLTSNVTYFYTSVYRTYDNSGKLILSSPAPIGSVTTDNTTTDILLYTLSYSTTFPYDNSNGAGQAIYYRTLSSDSLNFRENGLLPGYGVTTVYADNVPDSTLLNNGLPFLYAPPVGGELQNDPPYSFTYGISTIQRIFIISTEYPARVYFSKPFSPVRAPEFNAQSYIDIDPSSGPLTGIAALDATVILFKHNAIFALTGQGPDANGNGQFNPVSKISVDTGALSQNGIVQAADGIYFQSSRGIQLLDRGLQNQYIGAQIESYIQNATVTASLLLPTSSQVRFFLSDGTVLVYDYFLKKWSRFTSTNGYYATSACYWNDTQVTLDTVNGNINIETTTFTDGPSTSIAMTLETPWLKFAHPQSWNRLRRVSVLGDYKSTSTASLYFAYDWNNTYQDTITFDTGSGLTTIDTVYQWQARAPRQVMQAVRLKLVDTTITGESYDITNFALEYAVKGGIAKLPDRKAK